MLEFDKERWMYRYPEEQRRELIERGITTEEEIQLVEKIYNNSFYPPAASPCFFAFNKEQAERITKTAQEEMEKLTNDV